MVCGIISNFLHRNAGGRATNHWASSGYNRKISLKISPVNTSAKQFGVPIPVGASDCSLLSGAQPASLSMDTGIPSQG